MIRSLLALALLALASPAFAQAGRPSEDQLFGGSAQPDAGTARRVEGQENPSPATPLEPYGSSAQGGSSQDKAALSGPETETAFQRGAVAEDALKIGGMFYLRSNVSARASTPPDQTAFSMPNLVDGFFDARPTEHLRGMLLLRMNYDPTIDPNAPSVFGFPQPPQPNVNIDQLWLKFDIQQKIFVTVGKQHVKWGTGHFWNPTDYLTPTKRDPLTLFDARLGANMVKLQVPWEKYGWNFYALALMDNGNYANTLGGLGAAARAEIVLFGAAEFGLDAVVRQNTRARFGADLSSSLGPIDFYAESGVKNGSDTPIWALAGTPDPSQGINGYFMLTEPQGLNFATTVGASTSIKYGDNDQATIGLEYFHNGLGYDSPVLLPWLVTHGAYTPFYAGRDYLAVNLSLPAPGTWENTNFSFSNLCNLSDHSFILRYDGNTRVLSYLTVEWYAAWHYGATWTADFGQGPVGLGGELRLSTSQPVVVPGVGTIPEIARPLFDVGLNLRVNL